MKKRGQTELLSVIDYLLIILIVFGALFFWIDSKSSGKAFNDDFYAKQIAMVLDSAKPGSTVFIEKDFNIENGNVIFGSSRYELFTKSKIILNKNEKGVFAEVRGD